MLNAFKALEEVSCFQFVSQTTERDIIDKMNFLFGYI